MGVHVEREIAHAQWRRATWRSPAQQRAHAREQLLALERLHQVVVGTGIQPLHARLERVASGQDEDRHIVLGPQRARHLEPVEPGEAQVEDHQIGGKRSTVLERRTPVGGSADLISLHAKGALKRLCDVLVVLDDQDTRRASEVVHLACV